MCDLLKVSHCYPLEMESFPDELQMLLKRNGTVLHPDVRLVSGISYNPLMTSFRHCVGASC